MDARPILGLQRVRPSFLDDVSSAETCCGASRVRRSSGIRAYPQTRHIGHEMSRGYVLEHPVDDPDDEEDDDFDEDDEGEDDEDDDEEEIETWQVCPTRPFR